MKVKMKLFKRKEEDSSKKTPQINAGRNIDFLNDQQECDIEIENNPNQN